jgi:hypothetical protein
VAGAFDINMDKGEFATLNIETGWQAFRVKDVCTAAYHALRKESASRVEQYHRFLERLDGKELVWDGDTELVSGSRRLTPEDISFSGEITQDDHQLEFYMDVVFDPDAVFGTNVCTTENDDYVNVYANYDLEHGCVCDRLEVYLVSGTGDDRSYQYQLSDEEKTALLSKMESYCQENLRQSLADCRAEYLAEQSASAQQADTVQQDETVAGGQSEPEPENEPEPEAGPEMGMRF